MTKETVKKETLKWLEHWRFAVIAPLVMLGVWLYCVGCTPVTASPLNTGKMITAAELEIEFESWQAQNEITMKRFGMAGEDIEKQKQEWAVFEDILMKVSTGAVADLPGLLQLMIGGGCIGVLADRLRASGVIGKQKAIIKKADA